ncbi:MAG: alanine racemase, partial [Deltaproteobacteria bacterium]|nr:alanine racemase [Deltaproteobacteria bacterium]
LTPVVFDIVSLKELSKAAEKRKKRVKVHLKVDTGMGRLGVPSEFFHAILKELRKYPDIEIEGLLSHFSMTDGEEVYTAYQWKKYQEGLAMAREMGISSRYLHMANSGILTAFPEYSGNMVRPGIMLYGSYPSPAIEKLIELRPVLTLKTRIHFLKSVPTGSRISYGGTFVTRRESLIATLPVGYADGYSARLSNQGEVLIRGKRAPVVGRVCMDLIMVDVTGIPGISKGDEAILIGRQGEERITADEIAKKIGSIPYEVLCLIGKRVPRVYPDAAISNPGKGASKPLQLRIFRKDRVTQGFTLGEAPVLPKNACSQLPKVPPCLRRSGFAQAGARLWENTRRIVRRLPGKAAQHPCPVSILFFGTGGFIDRGNEGGRD